MRKKICKYRLDFSFFRLRNIKNQSRRIGASNAGQTSSGILFY